MEMNGQLRALNILLSSHWMKGTVNFITVLDVVLRKKTLLLPGTN